MMNLKHALLAAALFTTSTLAFGAKQNHGFAIVVDPVSYNEAKQEVDAYAQSVENDGLKTYLIVDKWGVPDSIRNVLYTLYTDPKCPIEGAVFVGDIPIAMIRDAQHLTSAFKMNQETFDRTESSVPSDRFYDDFDLKFNYLDHDSVHPLYHYYSLDANSPQFLSPEIYSARIKPLEDGKRNKYDLLRNYLKKVVAEKKASNVIDQYLFVSGHGYVSESMMARIDEKIAILENFPWMKRQQNSIEYIDHKREVPIKNRLTSELQRNDLDVAVLHHHGDAEIEYLNNLPDPQSIPESIKLIQMYLRETARRHINKGMNPDTVMHNISRNLSNVPLEWFDGALDSTSIAKDSIYLQKLDLFVDDFEGFTPNCRMVILDACFNGSFHKNKYIAGAYIFDEGNSILTLANSVNVLQDKWTDRYVGMMGLGMRAGYMAKMNPYLEGHLFGDPTFHFNPAVKIFDVNEALEHKGASFWKKQLHSQYPALQAMALRRLVDLGAVDSKFLLDTYKKSPSDIVRMESLVLLARFDNADFVTCLQLAVNDGYEMIQRFAVNFIAKRGDNELAKALVTLAVRNNTAERTDFAVKMASALFTEKALMDELDRQFNADNFTEGEAVKGYIAHALKVNSNKWIKEISSIYANDSLTQKQRLGAIRTLRNYHLHVLVPDLVNYMQTSQDPKVQVALLEALGWFRFSYQHAIISEAAKAMSEDSTLPQEVRQEALKTYRRLEDNRL